MAVTIDLATPRWNDTVTRGSDTIPPQPFAVRTADGCIIRGVHWRIGNARDTARPVVIINPATAVRCRYYFRFATFLFERGFDVVAYDYRGIGESRPATLRGFEASWLDWGRLDFEAVLQHSARSFTGQPIAVVAHSIGGFLVGLAHSNHLIRRVFTVGAQYAYWRDYAAGSRWWLIAKWHLAMPIITLLCGYFPGRKLGWLEDTPKGIVRDWALSRRRFEDTWRGRSAVRHPGKDALVKHFATVSAPTLALSVTDDEFGTIPAVERLLAYFSRSPKMHLRISPQSIGEPSIGHFAFFNSRLEKKLWHIPLEWLKFGRLPAAYPGVVIRDGSGHV